MKGAPGESLQPGTEEKHKTIVGERKSVNGRPRSPVYTELRYLRRESTGSRIFCAASNRYRRRFVLFWEVVCEGFYS